MSICRRIVGTIMMYVIHYPAMAEPTLQDVFGVGATQTATTITISKSDLPITPAVDNTAERLLAGIIKRAATTLTESSFEANADQSITIVLDLPQTVYRGTSATPYEQKRVTISLAKVAPSPDFDANDYGG